MRLKIQQQHICLEQIQPNDLILITTQPRSARSSEWQKEWENYTSKLHCTTNTKLISKNITSLPRMFYH